MKKLSVLFASLVLVSLFLAACGGSAAPAQEAAEAPAPAQESTEAPAADAAAPAESGGTIAPMDGATQLTDDTTKASAAEMAKLVNLTEMGTWEAWELPAGTTWDAVFEYYNAKAVEAGWNADAGTVKDIGDNKVAVFGKADGTRLAIIYLPTAEKVQILAIAGK
jgi:hypothetical protein